MYDNAEEKFIFFLSSKPKNHFSLNSYTGDCQMHLFYDFIGTKNEISNFEASLWWVFQTSSPKGNDRSPESQQVFKNSSEVSKIFFSIGQGQLTPQSKVGPVLTSIES